MDTFINRYVRRWIYTNNMSEFLKFILENGLKNKKILRYQAGILGHSMTEMKAFFTSGPNTLKIRSMVLRLMLQISVKKSRSL